jgi:hypothetical protein
VGGGLGVRGGVLGGACKILLNKDQITLGINNLGDPHPL